MVLLLAVGLISRKDFESTGLSFVGSIFYRGSRFTQYDTLVDDGIDRTHGDIFNRGDIEYRDNHIAHAHTRYCWDISGC